MAATGHLGLLAGHQPHPTSIYYMKSPAASEVMPDRIWRHSFRQRGSVTCSVMFYSGLHIFAVLYSASRNIAYLAEQRRCLEAELAGWPLT